MERPTIIVKDLKVKQQGRNVLDGISFQLVPGQHLAIVGASGSGKTVLGKTIAGQCHFEGAVIIESNDADAAPTVLFVEQRNEFKNLSNVTSFYYQQRYNSTESEDAHTVLDDITAYFSRLKGKAADTAIVLTWLRRLGLEHRRNTPLIQLSNGENKKLQLIRSLLAAPDVLILDQPFTGLDADSRVVVQHLINDISEHTVIILITSHHDLPTCITHVVQLADGKIDQYSPKETFQWETVALTSFPVTAQLPKTETDDFRNAVYMRNVSIRYGEKTIFDALDWNVRKGDKWLLKGPNGSGKSSLLSLINGDNPQAYSNEIYLFDKRRGSGESIWEIKRKIGYVSPELYWYFDKNLTVYETVASGFFDTMGLYSRLSEQQEATLVQWITGFHMKRSAFLPLSALSAGQQRLVMLMRALVKNPPLLILDEPCQGLDARQTADFINLVDEQCINETLIYVSHYEEEVPACVNRKLELRQGKAIQSIIETTKTAVA